MKTTNPTVKQLVREYLADPNCRPELWIKGEANESDTKEFLSIIESIRRDEQQLSDGLNYMERLHP
jgi:hypothetical protein